MFVEARPGRLQHRDLQGARRLRARRGDRGGAAARPQGAASRRRPRAAARSSAACCRRSTAPRRPACPAEIRVAGDHEFYDFAAKYLPEEHTELDIPARPARRGRHHADAATCRCGRSRRSAARAWRGSTSSCIPDGRLVVNEINTMPGFTPTSMYPQMWAATRRRLPGAGRPADPARAAARHRPALTQRGASGGSLAAAGRRRCCSTSVGESRRCCWSTPSGRYSPGTSSSTRGPVASAVAVTSSVSSSDSSSSSGTNQPPPLADAGRVPVEAGRARRPRR